MTAGTKAADAPQAAANENTLIDQNALTLEQLAAGVLAREFRPRIASVRRLAQAVLTQAALAKAHTADSLTQPGKVAKPKKKSKKNTAKSGKNKATRKPKKKARSKERKLAKIPGQKGN